MNHDIQINNLVARAERDINKHANKVTHKLTQTLRKKYRGKRVKCTCFDDYKDGEDYYLDDILLDIQAYDNDDHSIEINVIFNYKGATWEENDKPKRCAFHLEHIESVK